jgi:hypothetical protein
LIGRCCHAKRGVSPARFVRAEAMAAWELALLLAWPRADVPEGGSTVVRQALEPSASTRASPATLVLTDGDTAPLAAAATSIGWLLFTPANVWVTMTTCVAGCTRAVTNFCTLVTAATQTAR